MSASTTTTATLASDGGVLVQRVPAANAAALGPPISSLTIPDHITGKATYQHIPLLRQLYFIVRAVYVMLVVEFPLLWHRMFQGARNDRADVEGPFYISGAPNVQIADGKAIIASREDMEANPPYLLTVRVLSPTGKPLPNAHVDFWQATSTGNYYNSKYRLRGVFKTDAEGKCEILTVIPGTYGFGGKIKEEHSDSIRARFLRAGHFHLRISGLDGKGVEEKGLERLTTQIYVCRKNDPVDMSHDFVNYLRPVRYQNMVTSWATPSFYPSLSSPAYSDYAAKYSFPPIPSTSVGSLKCVDWWNKLLSERFPGGEQLKVMAGGETSIALNKKPRLYLY